MRDCSINVSTWKELIVLWIPVLLALFQNPLQIQQVYEHPHLSCKINGEENQYLEKKKQK